MSEETTPAPVVHPDNEVPPEEEAVEVPGEEEELERTASGRFTAASAKVAGSRGGRASSAGKSKADTSDTAIIRKLRQKAARGDVAAARELREWSATDPEHQGAGDEWLGLLTHHERQLVRSLITHAQARRLGQVEGEYVPEG